MANDKQKLNLGFDTSIQIDYNWDKATKDFYKDFNNWVKNLDVSTLKNGINTTVEELLGIFVSQSSKTVSEKIVETVKYSVEEATRQAKIAFEEQQKELKKQMAQSYSESDFKKVQEKAKASIKSSFEKDYGKEAKRKAIASQTDIDKAEKDFERRKQMAIKENKEVESFIESPLPSMSAEDKKRKATLKAKQTRLQKNKKSLSTSEQTELDNLEQMASDDAYKKEVLISKLGQKSYTELIKRAEEYHAVRMRQEKEYQDLVAKGITDADIQSKRQAKKERIKETPGKQYGIEAYRVSTAMQKAQRHRANNAETLKRLNAKAFNVELDEDTHTYYKLNKDGTRTKKQPEIVSVTQFASAISSGEWIKPLMDKVKAGEAKGLLPSQVLTEKELATYNNVTNSAMRGTAIHKVIELMETDVVSSMEEAVKYIDEEVAKLTAEGKRNPYGNSYKDEKGGFAWKDSVTDYFKLKNKYGLGNAVLSEKQLGMKVSVPQADGTSKLVHLAGTLDTLLSGGHLFDFKTTNELHNQNLTVQDNLLSLLLTASKQAGIINNDASDMGVVHLNNGQSSAEGSYVAKVGQATTDEIISWFQAFISGVKIDVQSRVEQQFESMDWERVEKVKDKNGKTVEVTTNSKMPGYSQTIGLGGKYLGTYASEYNKQYRIANPEESGLTIVDESFREQIKQRTDLTKDEIKKVLANTVTIAEMVEAQKKMQDIINKLTNAYYNSSDEMQQEFAKRVFKTGYGLTDEEKEANLKEFEGSKYQLFSALRNNMQDEMTRFDQDVTESWRDQQRDDIGNNAKEVPTNGAERSKHLTQRLREEGIGNGPMQSVDGTTRKINNIIKQLNELLDGLEETLKTGDEQLINSVKNSIKETSKDLLSQVIISRREVEASFIGNKGVEVTQSEDYLTAGESIQNDRNMTSIQDALGEGRSQVVKDFINNSLFSSKDNKSITDYTNISTKQILKLIEASTTMDKAFQQLATTLGITTDEAKELLFQSDEGLRSEYERSSRAKESFMIDGRMPQTKQEIEDSMQRLFSLGYDAVYKIFENMEFGDKNQIIDNILKNIKSGVGGRTKYGNNFDERIPDIMFGQSPFLSREIDFNETGLQDDGEIGSLATQSINNMLKILAEWKTWGYASSDLTKAIQTLSQILEVKKVGSETLVERPVSHRVFYDTETTGTDKNAMPVTFGAYNEKTGEEYHRYLDFGSDEENLKMAVAAMNIPDKNGELIKSSIELRNNFGILADEILDIENLSDDLQKKILTEYNNNKVTPEQLMRDVLGMTGETGGLAGFNNQSFDNEILGRYMMRYGSPAALEDFSKFLALPNQDVLKEATEQFGRNGNFTGQLNLQSLSELFLGQMDEKSHNAAADAKTTALVSQFVHNGVLSLIGQMSQDLAKEANIPVTNAQGYFTDAYKALVKNIFDTIKDLDMGKTFSENDVDPVKNLVRDKMGVQLSNESSSVEATNQVGEEHVDIVEDMAEAENQKIIVSKNLVNQLEEEKEAVQNLNEEENKEVENPENQEITQENQDLADQLIGQAREQIAQGKERKKLIRQAKEKNKPKDKKAASKNGVQKEDKKQEESVDELEKLKQTYDKYSKEVEDYKKYVSDLQTVIDDDSGNFDDTTKNFAKSEQKRINGLISSEEASMKSIEQSINQLQEIRARVSKFEEESKKDNVDSKEKGFYDEAKQKETSRINYEKEKNALREISNIDKQALKIIEKNAEARESIANIEAKQKSILESGQTEENDTFKMLQKQKEEKQKQLELDSKLYDGLVKRRDLIAQNITSENAMKDLRDQNTTFNVEAESAAERGIRAATGLTDSRETKLENKSIKEYESAYKKQLQYERDIARLRKNMEGQSGVQLKDSERQVEALQNQLTAISSITSGYDRQNGTLNGIKLSTEAIAQLNQFIDDAQMAQATALTQINTQYNKQQGLLASILGGFRNAFRNITDASLAYSIINKVKMGINEVITATKELDAALVDIQIATGQTRQQTRELLVEYADLADELGRTTQSVATASNDWLRAGYQGKEAAELTRASMMLSTLGMIDASDATTYLISTLKGWKIQANEVIDVVDKLTVTICGVCLATSIGHGFKCR